METLLGTLMGILVDVPLKDYTYYVHLEAITCLLALLSVHLQTCVRTDQSNIYRLIMRGKHSIHAPLLIKSLLHNFISMEKPPSIYGSNHHSFVFGMLLLKLSDFSV